MTIFHKTTYIDFSDLTEDEQFLVSIYRDWRRFGTTVEQSEYNLAQLLRDDPIAEALGALFAFFRNYMPPCPEGCCDWDELSARDERLLRLLASDGASCCGAQRCRSALAAVPLHLRAPQQILTPKTAQRQRRRLGLKALSAGLATVGLMELA